jgi:NTE family protein
MTETGPLRVAIACQGGGSHTAFTAGVLKRLLGAEELAGVDIVGLSGTSGGAVCALLAWSALLDDDPAAAGPRLEAFWADNSANTPLEQLVNAWVVWAAKLKTWSCCRLSARMTPRPRCRCSGSSGRCWTGASTSTS